MAKRHGHSNIWRLVMRMRMRGAFVTNKPRGDFLRSDNNLHTIAECSREEEER